MIKPDAQAFPVELVSIQMRRRIAGGNAVLQYGRLILKAIVESEIELAVGLELVAGACGQARAPGEAVVLVVGGLGKFLVARGAEATDILMPTVVVAAVIDRVESEAAGERPFVREAVPSAQVDAKAEVVFGELLLVGAGDVGEGDQRDLAAIIPHRAPQEERIIKRCLGGFLELESVGQGQGEVLPLIVCLQTGAGAARGGEARRAAG